LAEKQPYLQAPSGAPLVQQRVQVMFELAEYGKTRLERVVQKMSHKVVALFRIENKGFVR